MGASRRSSAGERVLEGRHVIGLFFLMLLFSGVFFTLGYLMGRGQVEAHAGSMRGGDFALPVKPEPLGKVGKSPVSTPGVADAEPDASAPAPNPDWEFYRQADKNSPNDRLKPTAPAPATSSQPKAIAASSKAPASASASPRAVAAPAIPHGSYILQVAAMRTENDAITVANDLRKKRFPAFVMAPQNDKYYRVQVGPYADQKTMQTAKKGLETAGFKAIIKH